MKVKARKPSEAEVGVEKEARRIYLIYDRALKRGGWCGYPWRDCDEIEKVAWKAVARAALSARRTRARGR